MSLPAKAYYPASEYPKEVEHITIYYHPQEFAGWPFNHGFWAFSETELLISFSRGPCTYAARYDMGHAVVDALGGEYVVLRSTDGGRSWPVEGVQSLGSRLALERQLLGGFAPEAPTEALPWHSPDFCLTAGFGIPPKNARHVGYIQFSRDRGRHWEGPYPIPSFGFSWVQVKSPITWSGRMGWSSYL
jgi:hypothetical protein